MNHRIELISVTKLSWSERIAAAWRLLVWGRVSFEATIRTEHEAGHTEVPWSNLTIDRERAVTGGVVACEPESPS